MVPIANIVVPALLVACVVVLIASFSFVIVVRDKPLHMDALHVDARGAAIALVVGIIMGGIVGCFNLFTIPITHPELILRERIAPGVYINYRDKLVEAQIPEDVPTVYKADPKGRSGYTRFGLRWVYRIGVDPYDSRVARRTPVIYEHPEGQLVLVDGRVIRPPEKIERVSEEVLADTPWRMEQPTRGIMQSQLTVYVEPSTFWEGNNHRLPPRLLELIFTS